MCCSFLFIFLIFWYFTVVDASSEEFFELLDRGHKVTCPWRGNSCPESLVQFLPPSPSALIGGFKDRCRVGLTGEHAPHPYSYAQKLRSLCGWEPRWLPNVLDCEEQSAESAQNGYSSGPAKGSAPDPAPSKEELKKLSNEIKSTSYAEKNIVRESPSRPNYPYMHGRSPSWTEGISSPAVRRMKVKDVSQYMIDAAAAVVASSMVVAMTKSNTDSNLEIPVAVAATATAAVVVATTAAVSMKYEQGSRSDGDAEGVVSEPKGSGNGENSEYERNSDKSEGNDIPFFFLRLKLLLPRERDKKGIVFSLGCF